MGEESLIYCYCRCTLVQPLQKRVCRYVESLKPTCPYVTAMPLLGIYQKIPSQHTTYLVVKKNTQLTVYIKTKNQINVFLKQINKY